MPPQVKGEFETTYFGGPDNPKPCGGVNFSLPYTNLPPNDLAPGSVNTQSINGFLCSSPWVAGSPFSRVFAGTEWIMGIFEVQGSAALGVVTAGAFNFNTVLVVTNIGVYSGPIGVSTFSNPLVPYTLALQHTWAGGELNTAYLIPGQSVTFVQSSGVVYFTGLMLNGIWGFGQGLSSPPFMQVTGYVAGRFIGELAGRLVVAECSFPGGGGTGVALQPTIAWSGVGIFGQAWDGTAGHDVWNPANSAFFVGNIGGFNLLSDVPDQITGMGTVGQSIILVRSNGLTQQDPNSNFSNAGFQPYNWYHMWSGQSGIGGVAGSVAQYGQLLMFRSADNVYTLSLSGGLSPMGNKIIAKIIADQRVVENAPGVGNLVNPFWNFASIYNVDGELHYTLTFSALVTDTGSPPTTISPTCFGYDYNLSEDAWHVWDFSQYFQSATAGAGFLGMSCPLVFTRPTFLQVHIATIGTQTGQSAFLFGAFTGYTTSVPIVINGSLFQFVHYDYDFNSNPLTAYIAGLYPPISVPSSTITFRAETLSLGHKLVTRRLRIQADNAPVPSGGVQQQAQAIFTGAGPSQTATSPVLLMDGDKAPKGQAIKVYYLDAQLTDDSVQPKLFSVFSNTNAFPTICAFRIASAGLIGNDTQATTP